MRRVVVTRIRNSWKAFFLIGILFCYLLLILFVLTFFYLKVTTRGRVVNRRGTDVVGIIGHVVCHVTSDSLYICAEVSFLHDHQALIIMNNNNNHLYTIQALDDTYISLLDGLYT